MYTNDSRNYANATAAENIANLVFIDNYPLITPFDISSIQIPLPAWANTQLQNSIPEPSFPPQNLVSSTNSATPTASPSQSPAQTPNVSEFPLLVILPLFASMLFIVAKHRHQRVLT
jgi:hypothetical protein